MIWIVLIFLGLVLGSFINALVWRLHEQAALHEGVQTKETRQRLAKLSIIKGRSMCSHCGHELAPKDLVPVLSWLWLRGKCRYCRKPIPDTPLPELILPLLFVLSYMAWPVALDGWTAIGAFATWGLALVVLVALAVYDARWFLLPDRLVLVLTILALAFVGFQMGGASEPLVVLRNAALGALGLSGTFYVLYQVSKGEWIGGGDIKLGVGLGLFAGGFSQALLLLFAASVMGSLYGLAIFAARREVARHMRVPFGPFLIAAAIIVVLWGTNILDWYSDLLFGF